jgi:hypothetical protein
VIVIAPSLYASLIEDIGDSGYSLIVNELTDVSTVKYLCICIQFYSTRRKKHVTECLGLIVVENGTAEVLYSATKQYLEKSNLKISNLLGIGTDGANSLCGANHSLYSLLKENVPNFKLVRCVCHSLNNACSKAIDELPTHVEFLCREIYSWFSVSSNRKIEYEKTFSLINTGKTKTCHAFIQPSTTRWLSRYNSVNIILENWLELKTHFDLVRKTEKDYTARVLCDMLNDNENYLYLMFLKPVLLEINQLNLNFQKTDMDVTKAYDDLEKLFLVLCRKIYKPVFVNAGVQTILREINNELALLTIDNVDFGINYYQSLTQYKISLEKKTILEHKMYNYLKRLCFELLLRLPMSLNHFKNLTMLTPQVCLPITT